MRIRTLSLVLIVAAMLSTPRLGVMAGPRAATEVQAVPLGFSPQSFSTQARWERQFLRGISAARCRKYLRRLTREPHVAGTPGDRRVTQYIFDEFQRAGLKPEIVEYRVLLSYPKNIAVELVEPVRVKLANPEPEIPGDKDTRPSDPMAKMPWNGYSPSADLTRPVVYVNYGRAEDYDELERVGVSVQGKLALARYFHGYRGGKSQEAERRGAAGIIVFSDPADDGAPRGPVYPHGPWGPLGHFQRGAVVYDYITPGDPLTPGWPSMESARRLDPSEAKILPKIPMVPLSAADAQEILQRLDGPEAPREWQGGLPLTYRVGGGAAKVHLALDMEIRATPIWNVIARIPGSEEPEKLVLLGNHHDAWVYGAVDPASGTASMLELARAFGKLLKQGFRPRRTIVLGNWDAEEYTLTGSTEWGEEFADDLRKNAVVCLNVDTSASGQDFSVSAVPALIPAIIEATQTVRDPVTGRSVYERWKESRAARSVRSYAVPGSGPAPAPFGLLGGGSDYMVFLQHNGVPSLDMLFDGPYGVYHSLYDDFQWMDRFGDPGFRYHAAMSQLWGLLALRFANADLIPLDYSLYAGEIAAYLEGLEKIAPADFYGDTIQPLIQKCRAWSDANGAMNQELENWRTGASAPAATPFNSRVMAQERALLDEEGIPGRPWFRHLIYAPLPSYEAETLPGLREALEAQDLARARAQAERLADALDRARAAVGVGVAKPQNSGREN
jgi:N-acetylated-alpha-linked acidic dipeptidase